MKTIIMLLVAFFTFANCYSQELAIGDKRGQFYYGNERIDKAEFEKILSTNQLAYDKYKSAKRAKSAGLIVSIAGGGILGWSLGIQDYETSTLVGAGLLLGGGLASYYIGESNMKKSLLIYNKGQTTSIDWEFNGNGVSMSYNF